MPLPLYRAAIIGTGRVGSLLERDPLRPKPHTHAGWYAAHPAVSLVAGADVDGDRLRQFGADWHVPPDRLYTDYRELLVRERPDLVSICGYAPQRLEMARAAIGAGARGLWIEKAVACSMVEADAMRALAAAAGAAIVVNHPRRVDGAYRAVADLIERGTLGPLESVHALFSGHFIHTGTHAWDLLDEWCGPWASVTCWPRAGAAGAPGWSAAPGGPLAEPARTDPGGVAHVRFEQGTHAFVSGSPKRYFIFQCDLIFEAGRIQIGNDVRRVHRPAPSPRYEGFIELEETGEPLAAVEAPSILDTLIEAVGSGDARLDSFDAAARALRLGLAVVRASQTPGRSIAPGDVPPDFYVASI